MNPVSLSNRYLSHSSENTAGYTQSETRLLQNATKESKDTVLTLETTEGDQVTLSLYDVSENNYVYYDQTAKLQNSVSQLQYISSTSIDISGFMLSVDGDLNDDEIADLQSAIQSLQDSMIDMKNGDIEGAISHALEVATLQTINEFEAELSYTSSKTTIYESTEMTNYSGSDSASSSDLEKRFSPLQERFDQLAEVFDGKSVFETTLQSSMKELMDAVFPADSGSEVLKMNLLEMIEDFMQTVSGNPSGADNFV